MAKKNALGRGLGALIESPDNDREITDHSRKLSGVAEIDIDRVDANPYQPRTIFDEESLNELASSIKEIGIIQPITVRKNTNGRFQLISGERRLRAAKIADISKIAAYIRDANDQNMLEMALVENIQREDLDAIEIAISYQRLIDECKLTQEMLSQRVGKKRATISNYLRLLKLPAEIQLGIKDQVVSMGHARTLINIGDAKAQLRVFNQIINKELSVRQTEEIVRKLGQEDSPIEKPEQKSPPRDYEALKNHLKTFFSANVGFKRNNNGSGRIVIPFNTDEDLERIIAIFDKLNT